MTFTRYALAGLPESNVVVTCDLLADGVHFQLDRHTPQQVGDER